MFRFDENRSGSDLKITAYGSFDENAKLPSLNLSGITHIDFDLSNLDTFNSFGIRTWLNWIALNLDSSQKISFSKLPKVFITQANLFLGTIPKGATVREIEFPYSCDHCNYQFSHYQKVVPNISNLIKEEIPCENCGKSAELDIILKHYFLFLSQL